MSIVSSGQITITDLLDGKDGAPGKDGIAGKDGVGIKTTVITYAISTSGMTAPNTSWTSQVPTLVKGQYLWTKTVWTYTDNSSETGYSVSYISKDGNKGDDGIAGKDGTGIKNTTITYAGSTSGTIAPTTGWTVQVPTVPAGQFLWTKTVWTYTDNSSETGYSVAMMGVKGDKGDTGNDGRAGKDGNGIKTTVITYTLSSSSTVTPANGWISQVPTLVKGQYFWTKTVWTYTDNSSETGYSVTYIAKDGNNGNDGIAGKDGTGIKTTVITYASHTNGTTPPTTGYTTTVPSVPAGQFLWTKTVWTYTDNSSETGYSVAMMGVKGDKGDQGIKGNDGIAGKDGKGINLTTITYSISTSGTTAPSTRYTSTVPTLVKGQYLWTKTVWRYTDNSTETGYSVTYIAKDGNNGNDGVAGKDGTGIKTTTITYAGSTSGTTAPNTGWTSTVPTVAAGNYLWTKTVWAYTDNTSETGYSVAMMGLKGERGKQIFKSSYENRLNSSGNFWSDLSPAPSIDNPPKIGDTVITPSGNILQIDRVNVGGGGGGGAFGVGDVLGNIKGPSGNNGDPGKTVSNTEPISLFKGLTWKYSGTSDLRASDGTVILPGTEYYWSGTNWILNEINSHNINGDNLNVTNGKFTDGTIEASWKKGTVAGSTNIENDHLIITRTDSSINTTNSIGLDSTQGLIMVYTENSTGRTISVGTNFQGMFLTDSTGTSASISPAGVKLASDVDWTQIGNIGGRRAEWKRENNRVTMNIHGGNGDRFPVITSSGTLLGILPKNARPPSDISMPATAQAAGATAQISINSTGEVRAYRWGRNAVYFGAYISYYVE